MDTFPSFGLCQQFAFFGGHSAANHTSPTFVVFNRFINSILSSFYCRSLVPGSHFPVGECRSLVPGSHFPVGECHSLVPGSYFLMEEYHSLIGGSHFPMEECRSLIGESYFPVGECYSLIGGSHFPMEECHSLIGGSHFPVGEYCSLVPGNQSSFPKNDYFSLNQFNNLFDHSLRPDKNQNPDSYSFHLFTFKFKRYGDIKGNY
jgi:hypothetical protein